MMLLRLLIPVVFVVGAVLANNSSDTSVHVDERTLELSEIPKLPVSEYSRAHGNPLLFPRIVGGTLAQLGEFPGKVSLQTRNGYHFCGGTIIDTRHVVTAAHCVTNADTGRVDDPSSLQIMGDDLLISVTGSVTRQVRRVSHIFVHTQYSLTTLVNDIAVIRVASPFYMTANFNATALSQATPRDGVVCSVAGWGAQYESGTATARLLRINATVIPRSTCNRPSSYGGFVRSGMFCAGTMLGGKDTCQGDSGGGLICNNRLSGVVSFGLGCARPNLPGVYADVSVQSRFISNAIRWNTTHSAIPVPTTVRPGGGGGSESIVFPIKLLVAMALLALILNVP